jgi:hypothetical protein
MSMETSFIIDYSRKEVSQGDSRLSARKARKLRHSDAKKRKKGMMLRKC